jgi:uncharacterized protein YfaS (alpha-2-macroglobulin family)
MTRSKEEIAISISPAINCAWVWVNVSTLACKISSDSTLPNATRYDVKIPTRFDSTSDRNLKAEKIISFTTPRPVVSSVWLSTWIDPETPQLALVTNQAVMPEELAKRLTFNDRQKGKIEVDISELKAAPEAQLSPAELAERAGRYWNISPRQKLSAAQSVDLMITPGLKPISGSELGNENRVIFTTHTFPEFKFIGITCRDLNGKVSLISQGQNSNFKCDPLNATQLTFSAPIAKQEIAKVLKSQPEIKAASADVDPWESVYSRSQRDDDHAENQPYYLNLPYGLKADTLYSLAASAQSIKDEFGRALRHDLAISFKTDHRAPRFVLDHQESVLEKDSDSKLPIVVNNVTALHVNYSTQTANARNENLKTTLTPFQASDIAYPFPLDIRSLLGGKSGIVQGSITGVPPQRYDNTQRFFSQVTPFAAHVKLGHFNSLIWVTSMSTGEPISDAKVSFVVDQLARLRPESPIVASATTDSSGRAELPGISAIDPKLTLVDQWERDKARVFAKIEKGEDLAIVPITWEYQAYDSEIYPYSMKQYGHVKTWGTTAQAIYRAGENVQFALWVRDQSNAGLIAPLRGSYTLQVKDPADRIVYEAPRVALTEFGSYSGEFKTPGDALAGWYTFNLKSDFSDEEWEPLRVLISDFTPAPFSVRTELAGDRFIPGQKVSVITEARLYAGGPYSQAATKVKAIIKGRELASADPRAKGFTFSTVSIERGVAEIEQNLNDKGDLTSEFLINEEEIPYGELTVESTVRDDRGKQIASITKGRYIGRERFVGLLQEDWLLTAGKAALVKALVTDGDGSIVAGDQIKVQIDYEDLKVARVKSAGNAYTNRYETEWTPVTTCDLVAAATAVVNCSFTPSKAGLYRAQAKVKDRFGREHTTTLERWSSGQGDLVWRSDANNQLKIIEEKSSYRVGETARFMVPNPFPQAKALFTVERYGVLRSWTETITGPSKVVEIPITPEHIPGFFFSAVLVSPRVDKPIEGQVDLAKPTFRMGYIKTVVDDTAKRIEVDVKPEHPSYRPGETVNITLTPRDSGSLKSDVELAVTVIDRAVFDLLSAGKSYFDPYQGFYSLNSLDVKNYNLLRLLIGRQKFEKKGANPGGDGGSKLDMRSITKFVSYWNPAIRPDASGSAKISFTAPDNLTNWVVFAMAFTKEDRLGLGEGSFVVNKLTEARSAIPNQARVGDSVNVTFTVTNRSNQPRTLSVEAWSEGFSVQSTLQKISLFAEPFKRYPIELQAKALNVGAGLFKIKAGDSIDSDELQVTLPIFNRTEPITSSELGMSRGDVAKIEIKAPLLNESDKTTIKAVVSNSIIGDLDPVVTYMRDYPYGCWEQKLSRSVVAASAESIKVKLSAASAWPESLNQIKESLNNLSTHQAPNGGMSFYTPSDDRVSPYLSAFTALALTWLEELGHKAPTEQVNKLSGYLISLLKNDNFSSELSSGERNTIRAMASLALAKSGSLPHLELNRLRSKRAEMSLFGVTLLLQGYLNQVDVSEAAISPLLNQILSAARESGESVTLNEPKGTLSPWLLDSTTKTQCAVLEALVKAEGKVAKETRPQLERIRPKLARSISIARGAGGHWGSTQENAFCMRALGLYSTKHETSPDNLSVALKIGDKFSQSLQIDRGSSGRTETTYTASQTDAGQKLVAIFEPTPKAPFYFSSLVRYYPKEPKRELVNSGFEVIREYSVKRGDQWTALNNPVSIKRGEQIKVDLFVRVNSPVYFAVVSDPLPGGLEGINRELKTSVSVENEGSEFVGPASSEWFKSPRWSEFGSASQGFYFRELKHIAARFYSEYLPPGNYHLSYNAQAIATGEFTIPPTHAEAMYDPNIYGDSVSGVLKVE